jgi:hypothetical protein
MPGRKKLIHFACQFEALGSGISRIQKQFQNPEALRILELFLDLRYFTSKCLKLARKVNQLFPAGLREMPGRKKLFDFACQFEALKSGISVFGFAIFHFQVPQTGTQRESFLSGRAL